MYIDKYFEACMYKLSLRGVVWLGTPVSAPEWERKKHS